MDDDEPMRAIDETHREFSDPHPAIRQALPSDYWSSSEALSDMEIKGLLWYAEFHRRDIDELLDYASNTASSAHEIACINREALQAVELKQRRPLADSIESLERTVFRLWVLSIALLATVVWLVTKVWYQRSSVKYRARRSALSIRRYEFANRGRRRWRSGRGRFGFRREHQARPGRHGDRHRID